MQEDIQEDFGWKLVHGDVFRPPRATMLLSVCVGSGCQILFMTFIALIFACLGFLSPPNRGAFMTAVLVRPRPPNITHSLFNVAYVYPCTSWSYIRAQCSTVSLLMGHSFSYMLHDLGHPQLMNFILKLTSMLFLRCCCCCRCSMCSLAVLLDTFPPGSTRVSSLAAAAYIQCTCTCTQ